MKLVDRLRNTSKRTWLVLASILLFSLIITWGNTHRSTHSTESLAALFVFEIRPLLETKCLACHGKNPDEIEGGLDLTSRQGMLRGGLSGKPAVSPGSVEESQLVMAIKRLDPETAMPPKSKERLTVEEISYFENWIRGGAPWPTEEENEQISKDPRWKGKGRISFSIEGALSQAWADRQYRLEALWAYQPLENIEIPAGHHPIDFLIDQQLEKASLSKAQRASPDQLVRRAFLDLTGLPPDYAQVKDFSQNPDSNKFSSLIESLLSRPNYGEQMAQLWLDVVRYADSDGFSNDYIRPNAWRYRDYVIRSFNTDKPYDQFVIEQIAGDELDPENPEMQIATGFLRMGPWEHTFMSVAKETRQLFLDDVVNSVGETFLSTPLMCAKCHDHKFDPISSLDYYRIQACFATTQFADRPTPFLSTENRQLMEHEKKRIQWWIDQTRYEQQLIEAKEESAVKSWLTQRGKPYLSKRDRRKLPEAEKPPRYLGLNNTDLGYRKVLQKRMQTLNSELRKFEPLAFSVYNGPDQVAWSGRIMEVQLNDTTPLAETHLLQGGSIFAPLQAVKPGILQSIPLLQKYESDLDSSSLDPVLPEGKEGRRLALARWIAHPDHPLTSRSIVNRIWQFHFGESLAPDPNNFGTANKPPVHSALIDYLATYLIDQDWSLKSLHRLIMTSEAYQRSTIPLNMEQQKLKDPENNLYAHFNPRRLHAEEIRDGMLLISGELNLEMGGIPARPEINQEVALQPRHIMGSIAQAYQPNRHRTERNRRTIYTLRIRSLENPFLSVFNQPRTEISCGIRSESTISPQALAMLNNAQIRNRALATAVKIYDEGQDPETQIREATRKIWLRDPNPEEMTQAKDYLKKMVGYHHDNEIPASNRPTKVKREMFEEMTGESFEFDERLDIYEDYESDVEYYQVPEPVRALADYCLLLFNSNEFMYVY
ncbi:MAG: PSD1 domain-containing protein [Saprospiraceae bacterium]|nr:PSD1 domain-containing protein [Saprospiraceae bacterium]